MAEFDFIDVDSAKIYTNILTTLMSYCREPLYPGDERRIFGEAITLVFVSLFAEFNDKMKQRTLQYARGEVLDALGERYNITRIEASSASATFRFSASQVRNDNIVIPSGTRVTADGSAYFATQETAVLPAGEQYVDLVCVCESTGAAYNGFTAGSVSTLVDLIPFVASATNITDTAGGDDGEPYTTEGDDKFRERIRLAPSALSTAGPESAYRYFVMSADPDIIDVAIVCPENEPNTVNIYPLMTNGELPDESVLQKVLDVLADDVRPMTDKVSAMAPAAVTYDVEIKYYTTKDNEAATIEAVEGVGGAIEQYNAWQTTKLGRDIIPDQLRRFILAPTTGTGALWVDIVKPTLTELSKSQVAKFSGTTIVTHEVVAG